MSLFNTQPTLWRGRSGKENAQLCWCFLSLTVLLFRRKLTGMCAHDSLFAAAWIVAHQAPLSTDFSRQENWSVLSFPTPGDLPNPEIEPRSLVPPDCRWILYHVGSLPVSHLGSMCALLISTLLKNSPGPSFRPLHGLPVVPPTRGARGLWPHCVLCLRKSLWVMCMDHGSVPPREAVPSQPV